MHLLPVRTPLIVAGDDVATIIAHHANLQDGDILVISSKVLATAEQAAVNTHALPLSAEAHEWSTKTKCSAAFMQAVLNETKRLHGTVVGYCTGALLTEVKPDGLKVGTIFAPNAGMDASNIAEGYVVGWPEDPVKSGCELREKLFMNLKSRDTRPEARVTSHENHSKLETHDSKLAVVISDSCCRPRRLGVTAFALTCCGIDPVHSEIGNTDLFGNTMRLTVESTADQLATAANMLMGNAAQSTPAVIIRDHGIAFSDFCRWVDGMKAEEDLFGALAL